MGIVESAKSYVGKVRYDFGANNVKQGVGDCSSFVQQVFLDNGVNIGRDTRTQWAGGTKVAKEDLQEGDIVFFQNTYRKGVSHVGIYVGNGKFIHNSENGGVQYGDLNNPYYKQHWLGGKRIAGVKATNDSAPTTEKVTGTVNPTFTAEEIRNGAGTAWNGILKVVAMLLVAVLAVVFFLQIFNESAVNIIAKGVKKI